jgi:hypothetical protein
MSCRDKRIVTGDSARRILIGSKKKADCVIMTTWS